MAYPDWPTRIGGLRSTRRPQPGDRNPLTGQPLAGEDRSRRPVIACINNDYLDGNNRSQLALDTVIVQYVPHEVTDIVEDSLGSKSIWLNLSGSGRALFFRNGVGFEDTRQSNSGGDVPRFYDGEEREIPLKPGNSWISVVLLTYAIA